jgi:hypothetical protein
MTTGTISIIVGFALLVFLKIFFESDEDSEKNAKVHESDASDDPGLAHLPGNSYHQGWSANHSERD